MIRWNDTVGLERCADVKGGWVVTAKPYTNGRGELAFGWCVSGHDFSACGDSPTLEQAGVDAEAAITRLGKFVKEQRRAAFEKNLATVYRVMGIVSFVFVVLCIGYSIFWWTWRK